MATTLENKRKANKTVRRAKDIPSGKAYKKRFSSYDIVDFKMLDRSGDPKWKRK